MCGIVGYIGTQTAKEILLAGLERLEYRGYDSAGIATVVDGKIHSIRSKGKLHKLREKAEKELILSKAGIGHTRWATHGKPEEHNAHPHMDNNNRIAVVQNGIIENYQNLKEKLSSKGYQFLSETDTEVIPNLIADLLPSPNSDTDLIYPSPLFKAVLESIKLLDGAFAMAIISSDYPDELMVVRQQAPIVLGFGQGEFFCASDVTALVPYTSTVLSLENGEIARLTPLGVEIYDFSGHRLKKIPHLLDWNPMSVEKQGFRHYMLKEIYEQPSVVRNCLEKYINKDWNPNKNLNCNPINLNLSPELYENLEQINILACGTSWHASLVGRYLLEKLANIPTRVQYASEFRYAPSPITANTLTIGVTQSGETADTLAALETEKQRRKDTNSIYKSRLIGITNRPETTLATIVDQIIDTQAGIEIGVAATKTFLAQLMAFYFLAIDLGYRRQTLSGGEIQLIIDGFRQLPEKIEEILKTQERRIQELAHNYLEAKDFIFVGRGINFPIALEGALKLKEISYIHAEGYPAGELKHGPIALLDSKVTVVSIAMAGKVYDKAISNAQEAKARDAHLIGVVSTNDTNATLTFDDLLPIPEVDELLSPMLTVIPLQILSYHIAAKRGLDVDQPRNLAKSVTVE